MHLSIVLASLLALVCAQNSTIVTTTPTVTTLPTTTTATLPTTTTTDTTTVTPTTISPEPTTTVSTSTRTRSTSTRTQTSDEGEPTSGESQPSSSSGGLSTQVRTALIAIASIIGGIALLALLFFVYNKCYKSKKQDKEFELQAASRIAANAARPFDEEPPVTGQSYYTTTPQAEYLHQPTYYSSTDPGYIVTTSPQQQGHVYVDPSSGYYVDTGSNVGGYYDPNYYEHQPQQHQVPLNNSP